METFVEKLAKAAFGRLHGKVHSTQWEFMAGPVNLSEETKDLYRTMVAAILRAAPGAVHPWLLVDLPEARRDLQGFARVVKAALQEHEQQSEDAV